MAKPSSIAEVTLHENRAIEDLRAFVAAQQAFLAIGTRGYGTPDVLSNPSIFDVRFQGMPPFLEDDFSQDVRDG